MGINPSQELIRKFSDRDSYTVEELKEFGKRQTNEMLDNYPKFVKGRLLHDLEKETAKELMVNNKLLGYIGRKTQAVRRPSSRRGSYANLGTLLVLLRNYEEHADTYDSYDGLEFNKYLDEVRDIPGCSKIQNHAINHRLNEDVKKYCRKKFGVENADTPVNRIPIDGQRGTLYKFNHELLEEQGETEIDKEKFTELLIDILELYFYLREYGNIERIKKCEEMKESPLENEDSIKKFLLDALNHNDAREFEVAAYTILKGWYETQNVFFGEEKDEVSSEKLKLYRTGRVNANDGGIDYVLKPVGRFFQATQNFEFDKYFLDIEKLSKFPISFVIQTEMSSTKAKDKIEKDAQREYDDKEVLNRYLNCFEEIFTLPDVEGMLRDISNKDEGTREKIYKTMLEEFATQYAVEYNIDYEFDQISPN